MKKAFVIVVLLAFLAIPSFALGANWTVMIYMAADNDLEPYAINDFLELSSVGSSSSINILVQLDRAGLDTRYERWTITHRFRVTKGMTPIQSNAIANWGDGKGGREVNMGDPNSLKDFVEWAMRNYPANHYLLVLWNHGQGWKMKEEEAIKWVCYDDNSKDAMWAYEIREALKGKRLSIVAIDACLMGTIEIMAELMDIADYFVASEEVVPANGFPYDKVMSALSSNPSMTPRGFSQVIVEKYREYYLNSPLPVTLSAIDMSYAESLINALNELIEEISSKELWSLVKSIRSRVLSFQGNYQVDLGNFANLFLSEGSSKASSLISAIESAKISEYHSSSLSGASGISIYFPPEREYNPSYSDTRRNFLLYSNWNDFLKSYFKATAPQIKVPWSENKPDIDGSLRYDEWEDAYKIEKDDVKIYLKCDDKYLYIGIDNPKDSTIDEGDRIGIYFDSDGDWSWPATKGAEGNYWIRYEEGEWKGLFRAIWGNSGMPSPDSSTATLSQDEVHFAISSSEGHLKYEIRIDYTSRWRAYLGKELHLYIFAYDAKKNSDDIRWPNELSGSDYGYLSPVNYGVIKLGEEGTPKIEVSPEEIDFGEVKIDETEEETLTIKNIGTATLEVEARLDGDDSDSFSITPTYFEILPGESANMKVYFTPKREGTLNAVITLESNDPLRSTCYVYLEGIGKEEESGWSLGGCQASWGSHGLSNLLLLTPLALLKVKNVFNRRLCQRARPRRSL